MQGLHHFRLSAFTSAVVHDRNAGAEGVNENVRIRGIHSVMQTQKHINSAEAVIRTHQLEFLVPRQIAQVNRAKVSEPQVGPDRHRVLGIVLSRLEARTIWIRPASSWQRRLDRLTGGRHDEYIQARDGYLASRFCYGVLPFRVE